MYPFVVRFASLAHTPLFSTLVVGFSANKVCSERVRIEVNRQSLPRGAQALASLAVCSTVPDVVGTSFV